jgi:hypothetical protein
MTKITSEKNNSNFSAVFLTKENIKKLNKETPRKEIKLFSRFVQ